MTYVVNKALHYIDEEYNLKVNYKCNCRNKIRSIPKKEASNASFSVISWSWLVNASYTVSMSIVFRCIKIIIMDMHSIPNWNRWS